MAITTIAELDAMIQTVVGITRFTARHKPVMRQLVRTYEWPDHKGHPQDFPKIGTLTAKSLVEGVDMVEAQTIGDTKVTITPAEVGLKIILTRRMLNRAPPGFEKDLGGETGRAYSEKQDKDMLGLFSGLSTGLSGAGAALTIGMLGAGRARVKGNPTEPGPEPLFCVLHPFHAWDIQSAIIPLSSGLVAAGARDDSDMALRRAQLGRLFGMDIYEDGNISVDANDDAYSGIFSRDAFILMIVNEGSIERDPDPSLRAVELNFVGEYGYGEWTDSFGYYLFADAAAPSA